MTMNIVYLFLTGRNNRGEKEGKKEGNNTVISAGQSSLAADSSNTCC